MSALEREIDELVYALYGLTPEEIKIVEKGKVVVHTARHEDRRDGTGVAASIWLSRALRAKNHLMIHGRSVHGSTTVPLKRG